FHAEVGGPTSRYRVPDHCWCNEGGTLRLRVRASSSNPAADGSLVASGLQVLWGASTDKMQLANDPGCGEAHFASFPKGARLRSRSVREGTRRPCFLARI